MSRKIAGTAPARTTAAAAGLLLAAGLAACGSGPAGTTSSGTSFTYWTSQWQPANTRTPGAGWFRAPFIIPLTLPAVATALIWQSMASPQFGLLSRALRAAGRPGGRSRISCPARGWRC